MHIHKPKPLHGMREIIGEIGVIVIGIMIAVSAEQAIELLQWRHKIAESEQIMQAELVSDDGRQAYMRAAISWCLDGQLANITQAIASGEDRNHVHQLGASYNPPTYTWDNQAWQAVVSADVGAHMGAERAVMWAAAYSTTPVLNRLNEQEFEQVDALRTLRPAASSLSPEEADRVSTAAETLKRLNVHMYMWSETFLNNLNHLGIAIPLSDKRAIIARARQTFGACVAIPNPQLFRHIDNLTLESDRRKMMSKGDTIVRP